MTIRTYRPADLAEILALFFHCVHHSCAAFYSPAQLEAWAPGTPDTAAWEKKLQSQLVLVAEEQGEIVGFGSLAGQTLDLLYVRPERQGQGVGESLCTFLEQLCPADPIAVHASRAARPFFAAQGYRLIRSQQVERRGQTLENFLMEKELT